MEEEQQSPEAVSITTEIELDFELEDCIYIFVLEDQTKASNVDFIITELEKQFLHGAFIEIDHEKVIKVWPTFKALAQKAEQIGLEKEFRFLGKTCQLPFKLAFLKSQDLIDSSGADKLEKKYFSPAQQTLLLRLILEDISVPLEIITEQQGLGLSTKLANVESVKLFSALQYTKPKVLEEYFPLHHVNDKQKLWKRIKSSYFLVPVHQLRDYFGEEVAFYFAWINFFNITLMFPGLVGLVLYLMRPKGVDVDHAKYLPVFAVIVTCWAVFFLVFWRRRQLSWAFKWDTSDFERVAEIRPEFFGDVRLSPVTDQPELFYPDWKKFFRYCVSFLAATPMLLLALKAMLLSLNLNGYIKDHHSIFYVHALCQYAEPGGIFAQDNPYYGWIVPTLLHSVVIFILNAVYRHIAVWCTDFENHRTVAEWNNSLITKRFLFEAFDCYTPLFYIAFYRLDINSLRSELIGLFWGDELRRLIIEVIVPFATAWFRQRSADKKYRLIKKGDFNSDSMKDNALVDEQIRKEMKRDEYEGFDDYLEMVIQFGYITLFASAMPLCSIVSVIFLFIETKADCFKLLFINKRPHSRRAASIGVWMHVLHVMTVLSILTNVLLIGFSSEQLQMWFPQLYDYRDNDHWISDGSGRYVVGIVFIMEHILLIFAALTQYFISPESDKTKNRRLRKQYLQKQLEKDPLWKEFF